MNARRSSVCAVLLLLLVGSAVTRASAQDPALVEALAPLLRAQDRLEYDADLFGAAALHPEALVRRTAALAIGRIGDHRGSAVLVRLLQDRDSTVLPDVIFALGLLADTSTAEALINRVKSTDVLTAIAVAEAGPALIRIGSPTAITFVEAVLKGQGVIARERRDAFLPNAVLDAWRLAGRMPSDAIESFTTDTSVDMRWRALFSLGRARAPEGGKAILRAATDRSPILREVAVRALTKRMTDTSALPVANVKNALLRGFDDERPAVRINALGAAATFADSGFAPRAINLLGDVDQNVRVAAAQALVSMPSAATAKALADAFDKKDAIWALRQAALAGLAHVDTAAFRARAAAWLASADLRERLAALADWGSIKGASETVFRAALNDPDPTIQAAGLSAWHSAAPRGDSALALAARLRLRSPRAPLRAAAVSALRGQATVADIDPLLSAWRASASDPEVQSAVLLALRDLARRVPDLLTQLQDPARQAFLARPTSAVVRGEAVRSWPELAARWGPVGPVETGRTLEDYRGIVRTLMLAKANPHVTIETDLRGSLDVELLAQDAPLTVANFLRLVDRHYFDGIRWHRVVPNFVVQAGDPTGTGDGGPGWTIRDEINRRRYAVPMMGMALSGPNTGGSQWFINVTAADHLDGTYTIFGQVTGSYVPLYRIVQGDLIRTIHR